jgi:excisionase family DNA binding protein
MIWSRGYYMPKSYLTVRDAAKQLELTEYRVRQLINLKEIKATKIKQWRILPGDLEEFIRNRSNIK